MRRNTTNFTEKRSNAKKVIQILTEGTQLNYKKSDCIEKQYFYTLYAKQT